MANTQPANAKTLKGLSLKEATFVLEYIKDEHGTRSATAAGYSAKTAHAASTRLLKKVKVKAAIAAFVADKLKPLEMEATDVIQALARLAMADVSEVVRIQRGACRYCYGERHLHQWRTEREYIQSNMELATEINDNLRNQNSDSTPFKVLANPRDYERLAWNFGGFGYTEHRAPNPDCPECSGTGAAFQHIADTSNLSDAGKALFDGVKMTAHGLEVKLADRHAALERIGRSLGLFKDRTDLGVTDDLKDLLSQVTRDAQSAPVPGNGKLPKAARTRTQGEHVTKGKGDST